MFPLIVLSQGQIKGFVYDNYNSEPIPYANVFLENNQGSITDINGYFIINDIDFGEHELTASFIGYSPKKMKIKITN